ncbi:MAG TPA: hypothetical protein VFP68_23070, partial [Burkholderiaceae bacterium]|nr:hypothetical protein [Burkholderiaceae bacterium]
EVGCLADCARLEWLLACCEAAPDVVPTPQSYSLLGEADPRQLRFALAPGLALLSSTCPVVSIWRAFRDGKLTPMREALASGSAENALVWRRGWKAEAVQLEPSTSAWFQLLMQGQPLGDALSAMGEDFAFEPWLLEALRQGWVLGVRRL